MLSPSSSMRLALAWTRKPACFSLMPSYFPLHYSTLMDSDYGAYGAWTGCKDYSAWVDYGDGLQGLRCVDGLRGLRRVDGLRGLRRVNGLRAFLAGNTVCGWVTGITARGRITGITACGWITGIPCRDYGAWVDYGDSRGLRRVDSIAIGEPC